MMFDRYDEIGEHQKSLNRYDVPRFYPIIHFEQLSKKVLTILDMYVK